MEQSEPDTAMGTKKSSDTEGDRHRFVDKQSILLRYLLATYRAADDVLDEYGDLREFSAKDLNFQSMLQNLMGNLIECAMGLKAVEAHGIAAKLHLWLLDDPDRPADPSALNRAQRLIHSLIRDMDEESASWTDRP